MKRRIRLTESDVRNIVKRSVKRILKEQSPDFGKIGQTMGQFQSWEMIDCLAEVITNCDANKAQTLAEDLYRAFESSDTTYAIDDIIRKYNPNCPQKPQVDWSYNDNF